MTGCTLAQGHSSSELNRLGLWTALSKHRCPSSTCIPHCTLQVSDREGSGGKGETVSTALSFTLRKSLDIDGRTEFWQVEIDAACSREAPH